MRRVFRALLFIPVLTVGQPNQKADVWLPFKYFLGTWKGTGKGEPGISQLEREYKLVLGGKFLNVSHKSVYQPQEKNPKGGDPRRLGILQLRPRSKALRPKAISRRRLCDPVSIRNDCSDWQNVGVYLGES